MTSLLKTVLRILDLTLTSKTLVSAMYCCWPAGVDAQAVTDGHLFYYYWAPSSHFVPLPGHPDQTCQSPDMTELLVPPGTRQSRKDLTSLSGRAEQIKKPVINKGVKRHHNTEGNGALPLSQKHWNPGAHRGGGRPTQAGLEVCGPAGRLLALCGQHHHRPVHLRRGLPHNEFWEESPGAKTTTQRKLTKGTSDNDNDIVP